MVDALASDRSNQPFGEAVLPRRAWSDRFVADAHGTQSVPNGSAIDLSFPKILSGLDSRHETESPHHWGTVQGLLQRAHILRTAPEEPWHRSNPNLDSPP